MREDRNVGCFGESGGLGEIGIKGAGAGGIGYYKKFATGIGVFEAFEMILK